MFAKLLKYDWKTTSSTMWLLTLCALVTGLLGGGVMRFMIYCTDQANTGNERFTVLMLLSLLLLMGIFLLLTAYTVSVQFILLYRFYKSRFTDEGYLTFTLPVTAGQVYWSSYLIIVAWMLISTVVTVFSYFLIAFLGTLGTEMQLSWTDVQETFSIIGNTYREFSMDMIVLVAVSLISVFTSIAFYMTAITVGSIIAKKHKLLAAIGVYIGATTIMSVISGTLSLFTVFITMSDAGLLFVQIVEVLFSMTMAAGGTALNIYLIKNKLNLP